RVDLLHWPVSPSESHLAESTPASSRWSFDSHGFNRLAVHVLRRGVAFDGHGPADGFLAALVPSVRGRDGFPMAGDPVNQAADGFGLLDVAALFDGLLD